MRIEKVSIDKLKLWEKNPRGIKKADYERLKRQIKKLGFYKPLLVYQEGEEYVVLGGNMRLRALKELGIKEVEVSVVDVKDEKDKIEYSLSDNDRAGYYEEEALAELVSPLKEELRLDEYKVDMGEAKSVLKVLMEFIPEEEEEEPEMEFAEELLESHNYVVLYFDNEVDWLQAESLFELKKVKATHYKEGFEACGIGRVVNGAKALEMLRKKFQGIK